MDERAISAPSSVIDPDSLRLCCNPFIAGDSPAGQASVPAKIDSFFAYSLKNRKARKCGKTTQNGRKNILGYSWAETADRKSSA
jgi:hypothetical protein